MIQRLFRRCGLNSQTFILLCLMGGVGFFWLHGGGGLGGTANGPTNGLIRTKIGPDYVTVKGSQISIPVSTVKPLLDKHHRKGMVVLMGITGGYSPQLFNMICMMRGLGMYNYVVAAFDSDLHKTCKEANVPVFNAILPDDVRKLANDGKYGGDAFKKITKIKSIQVLMLLQMGYDVFWTDVDIWYFKNPIPYLKAYAKKHDIVIQSNAPPAEKERNGYLRINSGFYLVKSNPRTIAAFQAIVEHAAKSEKTEQPSFYEVLCTGHTVGSDTCINKELGVSVYFLPRTKFANGLFYWTEKNSREVKSNLPEMPVIVHNNWIEGSGNKIERMKESGMWLMDSNSECTVKAASVEEGETKTLELNKGKKK
eukprot:Nk52_evm88s217 gene=Nk52_evmTU88s217